MQTLNPYLTLILDELNLFFNCFSVSTEHQIIKHLQDKNISPFDSFTLANSKDLFSAHFLCMHALYHLKNKYQHNHQYSQNQQEKNFKLIIQSVQIKRVELQSDALMNQELNTRLEQIDPLESYYLNPEHYFETQEDEIDDMLASFWQSYIAQDSKQEALDVFNLPMNADAKMIKTRYLQLVQKYHPDKGGCAGMFIKISDAKAILDKVF